MYAEEDGKSRTITLMSMIVILESSALQAATPGSLNRVAVLPFESAIAAANGAATGELFNASLLKHFPRLTLVERRDLDRVLGEQWLQQRGGAVDPQTAARLQGILGVDSLVLGRVVAVDQDNEGGGSLMMTARLVDTSSGRILWADTATVRLKENFRRSVYRFFSGAGPESDALVVHRLLQRGSDALVRAMGKRFENPPGPLTPALSPVGRGCADADGRIARLGESVLSEEAIYWAHRLKEEDNLEIQPGSGYADPELRGRLRNKILFWMDESYLPALSKRQLARLAGAKDEMRRIASECLPTVAARPERGPEFLLSRAYP